MYNANDSTTRAIAAIYSIMLEERGKKASSEVEVADEKDTEVDTDGDENRKKDKPKGDPAVSNAPKDEKDPEDEEDK